MPLDGFIGPSLHASSENPFAYRSTGYGQSVLETCAPGQSGYDRTLAKTFFDQAYDDAVARGAIDAGDVVSVTYTFIDSNFGRALGTFFENTWELAFSSERFDLVLVPQDQILYDPTDHDIHLSGLIAHPDGAIEMLMAMSDLSGQSGTETVEVDLPYTRDALSSVGSTLLDRFDGTTFTGTYADLADGLFASFMYDASYPGREDDLDKVAAALETGLFDSMLSIPLYLTATQTVFSSRVHLEMTSWHARISHGDLRYIYLF